MSLIRRGLLVLTLLAVAGSSGAAPGVKGWGESPGWDLYKGGVEDPLARVFQSPDYQKYLVLPGQGDPIVLTLRSKEVQVILRTQVALADDEAAITGSGKPEAPFVRKESDILFKAGGADFRLAPEPPLVGEFTAAQILDRKKDYLEAARAYRPKSGALTLLKNARTPTEVVAFFGSWCSHCKKHIPQLIKALDAAANPNIKVRFVGISEDLSQPEALITQFAISKTPTIVVTAGGREIGRIVEEPKGAIEEDLALLLMGGK